MTPSPDSPPSPDLLPSDGSTDGAATVDPLDELLGRSGPAAGGERDGIDGERLIPLYLGVLAVVALLTVAIGWFGRPSADETAVAAGDTESSVVGATSSAAVELVVDGSTVVLQGVVPDEGAASQLVALATARYGVENVRSELTVDPTASFAGAIVSVSGSAVQGDPTPGGLQSDIAAAFGLGTGPFDVLLTAPLAAPVRADAVVEAGRIRLSGAFPDQASLDQYVVTAQNIYGVEAVDATAVFVDPETTLTGATFGMSGLVDAGDTRATTFQDEVLAFFGGSNADTSGLQIDTSPESLARLEERLRNEVANDPILFASGSADIDPESDAILVRLAEAINAAPGVDVEVVGHTDNEGAVEVNQEISERRANAVLDRLVQLGVDPERLRARGAGESEPIADNETDEGKAANRRIAFEFDGAG